MSTITKEDQQRILSWVETHPIPSGLGTEEAACSIASINLALTGELTDEIPSCMSPVVGRWIIRVQDAMPADIRNGAEWKHLLPLAAGTGREHEAERRQIVMDWMWVTVLPYLQAVADRRGFGDKWRAMCQQKTYEAAKEAKAAAYASAYAAAAYAAYASAYAAAAYAAAAAAYADAASAAAAAADAYAAAYAAAAAAYADAADDAAYAAAAAAYAKDQAWKHFNPCEVLRRLIEVSA